LGLPNCISRQALKLQMISGLVFGADDMRISRI
jgi:hypothetical protein